MRWRCAATCLHAMSCPTTLSPAVRSNWPRSAGMVRTPPQERSLLSLLPLSEPMSHTSALLFSGQGTTERLLPITQERCGALCSSCTRPTAARSCALHVHAWSAMPCSSTVRGACRPPQRSRHVSSSNRRRNGNRSRRIVPRWQQRSDNSYWKAGRSFPVEFKGS